MTPDSTDWLTDRLGIEILEAALDRVVARMPVAGNRQPLGVLHGGAFCVLGETVASVAAALHAGPDHYAVGVELGATHHRGPRDGYVVATAVPLALGGTLCSHQVEVRDEAGTLLSSLRVTNAIRRHDGARPPVRAPRLAEGVRSIDLGDAEIQLDGAAGHRALTDFDQMEVGVWEHTVGSSTDVEGDEVAVVFAGRGTVTLSDGSSIDLYPGVLFTLREGEHTTWDITEPLRKAYLARR